MKEKDTDNAKDNCVKFMKPQSGIRKQSLKWFSSLSQCLCHGPR
jgi:hypothetical protein